MKEEEDALKVEIDALLKRARDTDPPGQQPGGPTAAVVGIPQTPRENCSRCRGIHRLLTPGGTG